jgi:hypothetical protein
MMEVIRGSYTSVLKRPHGVSFQKMAFFTVTAVETSNRLGFVAVT